MSGEKDYFRAAMDEQLRTLEQDPRIGQIIQGASEFFEQTEGQVTAYAEVTLDPLSEDLRRRFHGESQEIFSEALEILRRVRTPNRSKLPAVFEESSI